MAIIDDTSFTGLAGNDIRPNRPIRRADLQTLAADQAVAFEQITGETAPNGTGGATAHVHDGTSGAILPIALASWQLGAALPAKTTDAGSMGFSPFVWAPFFVPTGVTKVRVYVTVSTPEAAGLMKCQIQTNALVKIEERNFFLSSPDSDPFFKAGSGAGYFTIYSDVSTSPGTVNVLKLSAWEGFYKNDESTPLPTVVVPSVLVMPYIGSPVPVASGVGSRISNTDTRVPPTDYHLAADAFRTFSTGLIADDRAVCSYLTTGYQTNDALLWELLVGGDTYDGHNHADDTATSLDSSGALMEHALGSWAIGVARSPSGSSSHLEQDQRSTPAPWTGRVFASPVTNTTSIGLGVTRARFRLPGMLDDHALDSVGGATTKIKVAGLVRHDQSKAGGFKFGANLAAADGGSAGTTVKSSTITTDGLQLVTLSNLDASGSPGDGVIQSLVPRLEQSNAVLQGVCLYGFCAWVEP